MTLHMSEAAKRAESLVGGPTPHGEAGWCLEWVVRTVYGYKGDCRYRTSYGKSTSKYWAIYYFYSAVFLGKVVKTSDPTRIPRGAMVVSKGSSKYGHIFISLGDGWCATTDYPRSRKIGRVKVADLLAGWGHRLLGYIEVTGDGVDLRNPGTPDRMDPDNYYLGAEGDHVLWLGQRLIAHGYSDKYRATRTFTKSDVKAVAWFQRGQGWTGAGADGYPGDETLARLAS